MDRDDDIEGDNVQIRLLPLVSVGANGITMLIDRARWIGIVLSPARARSLAVELLAAANEYDRRRRPTLVR